MRPPICVWKVVVARLHSQRSDALTPIGVKSGESTRPADQGARAMTAKTETVLITGGAGFIGSATVLRGVLEEGVRVINVDALTYAANLQSLDSLADHPRYTLEQADICDGAALTRLFDKHRPNAVMHLAAESHVDRSIDGPGAFIATNITGTYALLEAASAYANALDAEARARFRFLHVSTDEVYGALGPDGVFTEDSPYRPNSPYAASKASSDMLVRAWGRTYGLPVLVSNCSNNYGPRQYPEKLIPVVILSALAGRQIPVYGVGANVRDWLYVDDHARALFAILREGRVGDTYNVGGDAEVSNIDLVRRLCAILDELRPSAHPHADLIEFVTDRPGHDFRYAIDASKLTRELGWTPLMTLDEGLRRTVQWYLDNERWWRAAAERGEDAARRGVRGAAQ